MPNKDDNIIKIADFLGSYTNDPLRFVLAAFPWGEGSLAGLNGPDKWQRKVLRDIGNGIQTIDEVVKEAVASGNGIGKSTTVAWLILWSISTFPDTRGVVTANTETQLRTKTWPELAKWYSLFLGKDLFTFTATSIFSSQKNHDKTWRIDAIPWSESNYEAFAGMHNQGRRLILIFDEASAIPDIIWETAEGALTDKDTQIIWTAFGNPTRNTGRFFDCFHRHRDIWLNYQVDSREVEITNKTQIEEWFKQYGADSDWIKIHVLGQFPSSSENQFISMELAEAGRGKHLLPDEYNFAPIVIGCDPAFTGVDSTAIILRQGLYSHVLQTIAYTDNLITTAQLLAKYEDQYHADGVVVDIGGVGAGVISAGRTMGRNWFGIQFQGKSPSKVYYNIRAYMWGQLREWLREGGAYDDDQQMYDDLIGPEIKPRLDEIIQLESKEEMKKRGLPSPDKIDSLALTFAVQIRKKPESKLCNTEYNFFPNRHKNRRR
jgi:hypothetical protein